MNNSNSHIIQVYNSRKNLLEILETRGFNTSSYNNFSISEIGILTEQKEVKVEDVKKTKKVVKKKATTSE